MKQSLNPYKTVKDKIQILIEEYQFQEYEEIIHKELDFQLGVFYIMRKCYPKSFHGIRLEIAELIVFLRKCLGNEIRLRGTVQTSLSGEIKGTQIEYALKSLRIVYEFEKWANALLESDQDGVYEVEFGWECKKTNENSHFSYPEAYSNEELAAVISYEKKQLSEFLALSGNSIKGELAHSIYIRLNKLNVFNSQQESSLGKTKEYAFIFDLICILGEHSPREEIIKDKKKFDEVKAWIKAYNTKIT